QDKAIDQVVITSSWLDLPARIGKGDLSYGLQAIRNALLEIFDQTSATERRFFLIGTVPELPRRVVECGHLAGSNLLRAPCNSAIGASDAAVIRKNTDFIDALFKELADGNPNVRAVIPAEKLCMSEGCEVVVDGEFLW